MFCKKFEILFIIWLVFIGGYKNTIAQKEYKLNILIDSSNKDIKQYISYKTTFSDTLSRKKELNKVIVKLWEDGFITASYTKYITDSTNLIASINKGNKYTYLLINDAEKEFSLQNNHLFKHNRTNNLLNDFSILEKQIELLIKKYENNGYPFVEVQFDSIVIGNSSFKGNINVKKNEKFYLDSIIIKGSASSSAKFINKYLGLKTNSLYNEALYRAISKKIKSIEFFKINKPFEIEYYTNKANLTLFIDKIKANQFDGIIGFMPNAKDGKLIITGDVKLLLSNSLNRGEQFAFKWHKFDKFSQELRISADYPYMFSFPFGFEFEYYLFKKDTSYITNTGNIGFKYLFEGNNYLKAIYKKQNTTLLLNILNNDSILYNIAPSKINYYGLELKKQNLNNIINPSKGYVINLLCTIGNKEIKNRIDSIEKSLGDLNTKSTQYILNGDFGYYIPILSNNCIYLNTKNGKIINKYLFENDLYRLGGLKTLRGFDEESILASFYSILSIEYHYLFEEYSYFNIFFNACHYENKTLNENKEENPFGFGAGINFKTKVGIFSINYALGKQEKEPLYLKKGKIHFGIINYF